MTPMRNFAGNLRRRAIPIAPLVRLNDAADAQRIAGQIRSPHEQGCGGIFVYLESFGGGVRPKNRIRLTSALD